MALILSGDTGPSFVQAAAMPAGTVLQTLSAVKTARDSTNSQTFVNISGLSVSITPRSSTSKILVMVSVVASNSTQGAFVAIGRNGTTIAIGDANGSRTQTTLGNFYNPDQNTTVTGAMNYLDSPASASAITYTAQWRTGDPTGTIIINGSPNNNNASYTAASISTITVMEIAV